MFTASNDIGTITVAPSQDPELKLNFTREPFARTLRRPLTSRFVGLGQGRPATQGYVHPHARFADPDAPPAGSDAGHQITSGGRTADGDGTRENPEGEDAPFTLIVNGGDAPMVRAAELIAQDFAEVGIDVTVSPRGCSSDAPRNKSHDLDVTTNSPHAVADSMQFIPIGNLWEHPHLAYPNSMLYEKWRVTEDERISHRGDVGDAESVERLS